MLGASESYTRVNTRTGSDKSQVKVKSTLIKVKKYHKISIRRHQIETNSVLFKSQ